ncbi:MAG: adenylate kinase [Bacteroidota bacterium]
MKHIILFGPPGAGKGTQAQSLTGKFNFLHISTGDLLRAEMVAKTQLGLEAKKFVDAGELVPDHTVIGMIANKLQEMSSVPGVIYDGFPRTIAQAEALDTMLASRKEKIDGLLSLEVPHDELVKRILIRSQSSGRTDDADINTIENRITVYNQKTQPLIDFYIKQGKHHSIPGTGTIEEISERLIKKVETLR